MHLAVDTKLESRPTYTVSAILYGKTEPGGLSLYDRMHLLKDFIGFGSRCFALDMELSAALECGQIK